MNKTYIIFLCVTINLFIALALYIFNWANHALQLIDLKERKVKIAMNDSISESSRRDSSGSSLSWYQNLSANFDSSDSKKFMGVQGFGGDQRNLLQSMDFDSDDSFGESY
jgi:nitrogen fixation-related uncharacterized protein